MHREEFKLESKIFMEANFQESLMHREEFKHRTY